MLFKEFDLSNPLRNALDDLGLTTSTPIQEKAFKPIVGGKDIVGIAQTGTGKTFAYLLPILRDLKFSKEKHPRVLIMVPTRELVLQVAEAIEKLTAYQNTRVLQVYGDSNINRQREAAANGADIVVATPGRLYDLIVDRSILTRNIKKLVIDEVDVMLDLGFRPQLNKLFDLIPEKRQNIMFSATMTEEVEELIDDYFEQPETISIAVSGTPLDNITQFCYSVPNFLTKANLLIDLMLDREKYPKTLVFVSNKKRADKLFEILEEAFGTAVCVIHSNKTQNYRIRSIEEFDQGNTRIMVSTDVMARGLDLDNLTHVVNFDTPEFPENYMHRIGRTGRAEREGHAMLFYTEKEIPYKNKIEELMGLSIPENEFPEHVEVTSQLLPDEREKKKIRHKVNRKLVLDDPGEAFHEKKDKNKKVNLGSSVKRKREEKYKKPQARGDKIQNMKKRKRP